jgi:hypothetical protein
MIELRLNAVAYSLHAYIKLMQGNCTRGEAADAIHATREELNEVIAIHRWQNRFRTVKACAAANRFQPNNRPGYDLIFQRGMLGGFDAPHPKEFAAWK